MRILFAIVIAALPALAIATPASAHEARTVGRWHFAVGWGDEPAYAGVRNSVALILTDANDKPVVDLGDTLRVEVSFGTAAPLKLSIEPNFEVGEFGTPGDYRAWLVPTRPGDYTFHLVGSIKGQKIDAKFTSSKTTFDAVQDATDVEYPVKDPSNADLAGRIEREIPRIDARDASLASASKSAKSAAGLARTLAVAGLAIGVVALVIASRSRKPAS